MRELHGSCELRGPGCGQRAALRAVRRREQIHSIIHRVKSKAKTLAATQNAPDKPLNHASIEAVQEAADQAEACDESLKRFDEPLLVQFSRYHRAAPPEEMKALARRGGLRGRGMCCSGDAVVCRMLLAGISSACSTDVKV